MCHIQLKAISKSYPNNDVIKGIDITVEDGEFMVFVGPSGCGKSTTLRMIAGLESITSGDLLIDGRRANDIHPSERGAAMVFQSYALYPHMTVRENMGFSLKMAGLKRAQRDEQVAHAAEILKISDLLERYPKELSGGQRQRVAIGRAIVRKPKVFLFDEPLSNLDAALRVNMRIELSRLHKQLKTTMIYVTHDQVEAMTMGDRIAIFNAGRVEQIGRPVDVYRRPANKFVAQFLGAPAINFITRPNPSSTPEMHSLWAQCGSICADAVSVGIRPENIRLVSAHEAVPAKVVLVEYLGDTSIVHVKVTGCDDILKVKQNDAHFDAEVGDMVGMAIDQDAVLAFDGHDCLVC